MSPPPTDWSRLFDKVAHRSPPATPEAVAAVFDPVSDAEADALIGYQRNPWRPDDPKHATWRPIDPRPWQLPTNPLPVAYKQFLAWSDGAGWETGDREFSCFGCREIRDYLLRYHFPEYMPGVVPIGLDGGGLFCLFDLRESSSSRVWALGSGDPFFDGAVPVADTFEAFCCGRVSIGDVYANGYPHQRPRRGT